MTWLPIIALPNIDVRCSVESTHAAIVSRDDDRVIRLCKAHPALRKFLDSFRDAFKRHHRPSVFLLREDAASTYRHGRAIAAFRDILVMSSILLNRAAVISAGRAMHTPLFSNSFDFYPWMLDRDYEYMTAMTPAISALDEPTNFSGQTNPEISYHNVDDLDEPLFARFVECWERCFATASPEWKDRALFRSLNMAAQAARTPFTIAGTFYDTGRLVALWVSAFETLVHPGGTKIADKNEVTRVMLGLPDGVVLTPQRTHSCTTFREWALNHIYKARNDYLHGNPVADDRLILPNTKTDLSFYGSLLYRLVLTEFLNVHYEPIPIPSDASDEIRIEARMSQWSFYNFQQKIEEALSTMAGPKLRRPPSPRMYRNRG